jgi:hypothetical protein
MRIVIVGQQAFGKAMLEALLRGGTRLPAYSRGRSGPGRDPTR